MPTTLAFRTKVGAEEVIVGQSESLGIVNVASFSKIRILVVERPNSIGNVRIRLAIIGSVNERAGDLDSRLMTPNSQQTRVYDVPSVKLEVIA
jgi:hypothetical protein